MFTGSGIPATVLQDLLRARVRGDRNISLVSVLLGGALDIGPIVRGRQGDLQPVARCRGRDDACTRLFAFAAHRM